MWYCDIIEGKPRFRFQENDKFAYWAQNILVKRMVNENTNLRFTNENIDETLELSDFKEKLQKNKNKFKSYLNTTIADIKGTA